MTAPIDQDLRKVRRAIRDCEWRAKHAKPDPRAGDLVKLEWETALELVKAAFAVVDCARLTRNQAALPRAVAMTRQAGEMVDRLTRGA